MESPERSWVLRAGTHKRVLNCVEAPLEGATRRGTPFEGLGETVFQIVSILSVVGAVVCGVVHWLVRGRKAAARRPAPAGRWQKMVYATLMLSVAALTVTGLWPAFRGEALRGWWLMVHVKFGGLFAVALAAAALTWAGRASFGRPDDRFDTPRRLCFWAGLTAGLAVVLSIMLSMTDWFSSEQIDTLGEVHRWAALAVVVLTMTDCYRAGLTGGRGGEARDDDAG